LKAVLDASALLAYLQEEPGNDAVEEVLSESGISAVNWAEVLQKCVSRGVSIKGIREEVESLGLTIEPFTATQAETAGSIWRETMKQWLSLGDRACLAFGMDVGLPILTTDRVWNKLKIGLEIRVLR